MDVDEPSSEVQNTESFPPSHTFVNLRHASADFFVLGIIHIVFFAVSPRPAAKDLPGHYASFCVNGVRPP